MLSEPKAPNSWPKPPPPFSSPPPIILPQLLTLRKAQPVPFQLPEPDLICDGGGQHRRLLGRVMRRRYGEDIVSPKEQGEGGGEESLSFPAAGGATPSRVMYLTIPLPLPPNSTATFLCQYSAPMRAHFLVRRVLETAQPPSNRELLFLLVPLHKAASCPHPCFQGTPHSSPCPSTLP